MAEKNDFNPMALPEELRRAKNKLIYFSLAIIFISVFEPTSTGFLNNFSVKVTHYPHIALWAFIFIYLWFFIRYLSLLSYYYDFLNFLIHPFKSLKAIPILWQEFSNPIRTLENNINDFNEQYPLGSDRLKVLKALKNKWDEEARTERKIRSIPRDTKDANEKAYLAIREHERNLNEIAYLKKRVVTLRSLGIMDILAPVLLSLITLTCIGVNYSHLVSAITSE